MSKSTTDKVNPLFRLSAAQYLYGNATLCQTFSDSAVHIRDERIARLLVLLQRVDDFGEGLEELPEPELSEIVSSAIRVSGFVDPGEVRDVIAIVLEAIEMRDRIPKQAALGALGIALSDA
jgi:hypothetical protein